jgi:hypothetical protein
LGGLVEHLQPKLVKPMLVENIKDKRGSKDPHFEVRPGVGHRRAPSVVVNSVGKQAHGVVDKVGRDGPKIQRKNVRAL